MSLWDGWGRGLGRLGGKRLLWRVLVWIHCFPFISFCLIYHSIKLGTIMNMNSAETGRKAEQAARVYLEMRGFKIIEQNWRLPKYEIDIVAIKDNIVHFVEVKYRYKDDQGSGFDAITETKLKQMKRAAWAWVDENKWHDEYVLSAIEIAGSKFSVIGFVENAY